MSEDGSFSSKISADEGYQKKRKYLVLTSILLLAISASGASVLEANTFILRIEFENREVFAHLLLAACIFLTVRYYGYAQIYHDRLANRWKKRTMSDSRVYMFDHVEYSDYGMLSDLVAQHNRNYPDEPDFTYIARFPFRRELHFFEHFDHPDTGEPLYYTEKVSLLAFNDVWKVRDYLKLLRIEIDYRFETAFKTREYLDVFYPYLLSAVASLAYLYRAL